MSEPILLLMLGIGLLVIAAVVKKLTTTLKKGGLMVTLKGSNGYFQRRI